MYVVLYWSRDSDLKSYRSMEYNDIYTLLVNVLSTFLISSFQKI